MIGDKKIVVVMPAYNADCTLEDTYREIPFDIVDEVILTDDHSMDNTAAEAERLGINHVIIHENNRGYGGNQKTCYNKALEINADIIIMLHPDYQYTPKLIHSMAYLIANDLFPVVLGSRILGRGALEGGMPKIKYLANRVLTLVQNIMMGQKLSEYHTGFRAFSKEALLSINYEINSDNFVFDNEMLAQLFHRGHAIGEITCPTKYFPEASSISLSNSVVYAMGVLRVSFIYMLNRWGLISPKIFRSAPDAQ